jgi:hypothetical protein
MFDILGTYNASFYTAGSVLIISSTIMIFPYLQKPIKEVLYVQDIEQLGDSKVLIS